MRGWIRQQRGGPVFVGDAEPAVGHVEVDELLFFDVLVGEFLQSGIAEHADQALMEDVVAERLRRAVARNQRIRIKSDRVRALVGHLILDGEQEFVVDRDRAAKFQPFTVVVGQGHRSADTEHARTCPCPHGFRCRQFDVGAAGAGPAEFGVEGIRRARRRKQRDRRRFRIDGFAELHQREIVDAAALERNRALHIIGRDWNARRSRERRGAVDRRGGRGRGRLAGDLRGSGLCGCRRRLARLRRCRRALLLLLDLQLFLPRFLLRHADKILPADKHECREHDGEDGILIVVHHNSVLPLRLACTRRNAPSKSCVIAANG